MKNFNFINKEANMLQKFFNNDDIDWFGRNMFNVDYKRTNGVPPVNIAETDNSFNIEMAAPGYEKKDFKVNVDKNILTISVEKKEENCSEPTNDKCNINNAAKATVNDKYVYRREFCFSSFSRSFTLPDGVDTQKITGAYENGILSLTIPKAEIVNTKTAIEIK